MFKRVQFEEWQAFITIAAFLLCFLTFLYFCWKALRMIKRHRDHMSSLPLESENLESPANDRQ